ncbi:helix-hairpin-helix domain-containing protein [Promicromonospora kroppenstedtii]|uniref:Helix-hairpin-helix domain-containing protein n=1 Tax=Promicromonospora kroppenstedtii TaxID=440482 RepID=A0ABW7XP92_9MICO
MGWFIAQSLAFIVIAALIGLAVGIWIGWLVWGRRKGKHTAEKSEAVTRANTAEGGTAADDAEAGAEPVRVLAVAGAAGAATAVAASDEPVQTGAVDAVDTEDDETEGDAGAGEAAAEQAAAKAADGTSAAGTTADDKTGAETAAQTGEDEHDGADGSAVVAEAEAVAREAAEQAAAKAAALADAGDDAAEVTAVEAVVEPGTAAAEPAEPADDLRRIEGIGPKIAAALAAAGYTTYAKIAGASEDELREAVAGQGIKFAPAASSWADQAQYLVDGDTAGFEEYQDYLVGGQERRAKFNENVDYTDVDEVEGAEAKAEAIAADEAAAATAEQAEAAGTVEAEPAEVTPEPEPEPQDLQRIEGIGPKIETALTAAGYTTYAKVAGASEDELRAALAASGIKFAPAATSWADQAQYLVDGDEDGLREYQDYLIGGQERRAKFNENVDYTDVDEIEGAEAKAAALAEDEAEAAAAPEPAAEPAPEPEPEPQDLQRIEGIGPKIEAALKAAGYATYAKIAAATETEIREALATGGIKFAPAASSWADQAQYLADGDEDGLQEFQDYLIGGQDRHAKFRKDVDYTDVDEIEGAGAKAEAIAEDEAKAAAAEDDAEPTGSEVKA